MKDYKRVFNVYSAWDYTREIEDLNKMSENGWQLVKGGLFSNKFKKNADIRYKYQLDYNTKIDDMGRYIETFREQGWEYVNSTFNGWHYFRKLYDATSDDYEIYNDSQSLKEMQAKWQNIGKRCLGALIAVFLLETALVVMHPRLPSLLLTLVIFFEIFVIGRGLFVMKNPQRADGHKRSWNGMPAFFTILLIGLIGVMVLIGIRGESSFNSKSQDYGSLTSRIEDGVNWGETKVTYPDFYEFGVSGKTENPITLSLVNNQTGKVEASIRLDSSKATGKKGFEEDKRIYLRPGKYTIYGSDFAGGSIDIHVNLN